MVFSGLPLRPTTIAVYATLSHKSASVIHCLYFIYKSSIVEQETVRRGLEHVRNRRRVTEDTASLLESSGRRIGIHHIRTAIPLLQLPNIREGSGNDVYWNLMSNEARRQARHAWYKPVKPHT